MLGVPPASRMSAALHRLDVSNPPSHQAWVVRRLPCPGMQTLPDIASIAATPALAWPGSCTQDLGSLGEGGWCAARKVGGSGRKEQDLDFRFPEIEFKAAATCVKPGELSSARSSLARHELQL